MDTFYGYTGVRVHDGGCDQRQEERRSAPGNTAAKPTSQQFEERVTRGVVDGATRC